MLPLHGKAGFSRGLSAESPSCVVRLQSLRDAPALSVADFALVRSEEELEAAARENHASVMIVSDQELEHLPQASRCARLIRVAGRFNYFAGGDIIGFHPDTGQFRMLYRRASRHNSILVTDRCNHYCLMCSQPPKEIDDRWLLQEIKRVLPLVAKNTEFICFTGGEPLLDWNEFLEVLAVSRDVLPDTSIHVLSNGRAFARDDVVAAWAGLRHPHLSVGIPIYAAVDHAHDYVVQARGAFDETVLGVLKLKDRGQRVEIRVVLHALTAARIAETCTWLARNLPFVDHVALMGLENTGFALANADKLWIDPIEYRAQLAEGVAVLAAARVKVSVYNLQRCVLDRSVWPYAAQSISDWKNGFVEQCEHCIEKDRCSGFFTSGRPRLSRAISPILS